MTEAGHWQSLRAALQLLTILPTGHTVTPASALERSLFWYPVVGVIIGALLLLISLVIQPLPDLVAAAIFVFFWVIVTGGLHLDGVADCADAWVGGLGDRDRTLMIMKDPACGPIGVLSLIGIILFKVVAVQSLLTLPLWPALVLCVPLLARALMLPVFKHVPYVREAGLGAGLAARGSTTVDVFEVGVLLLCTILCFVLLPITLLLAFLLLQILFYFLWRAAVLSRLGGFTGDCAGALIEGTETILLLAAVVLVEQGNYS